ncbi:MAG: hypothetical protein K6F84_08395 [Lachnospiraceae bacterium]|nr:hypothetical protein [Lachnospiraceae bacterium]
MNEDKAVTEKTESLEEIFDEEIFRDLEEKSEEEAEKEPEKKQDFSLSFDIFGRSFTKSEEKNEEPEKEESKVLKSEPDTGASNITKNEIGGELVSTGISTLDTFRGIVKGTINENMLILYADSDVSEDDLDRHLYTLLVNTASKGRVENGRYKAATKCIKGYITGKLDNVGYLMETPDMEITDEISGKSCTVIQTLL